MNGTADRWHVDLPFRGSRPYVHSASLCNHLRDRFAGATGFELVMREWMAARVLFAPLGEVPDAKATARIDLPDGSLRLGLTDDPAHPVTERVPYDEDALVDGAAIADRTITVPDGEGSLFDRMIAANKAVINRALDPGVKLIAAKIVLPGLPGDDRAFQLRLASNLGTRLFRSTVLFDGESAGELVYYGR